MITKRTMFFILVAILVVAALAFTVGKKLTENNSQAPTGKVSTDTGTIDYSPPTEEEKQAADTQKDENVKEETERNNPDNVSQKTTVLITDAGIYDGVVEVRSFIPDHYEDGTCTLTFVNGSKSVTKDTPAYRDVSTTICTNPTFPAAELGSGSWQVTVTYTAISKNTSGTSQPSTIVVTE